MKKALAICLLIIVFPIYAQDPLKPIIDRHIIGASLSFKTQFAEELFDVISKGLTLTQQTKTDYELNKGNIITELHLGLSSFVHFLDGTVQQALFNITSSPDRDIIRLEFTFQSRPPIDVYLRFNSGRGDPLFYLSYTYPAAGQFG